MTELMRWDDTGTLVPQQNPTQRLRDWVDLFREVVKAAEFLSKTPFVPKDMLGKPADVAAAIMKGHELGMDPLDALANIYVIHGRVGFYAEFQRRRIIQAGHTFKVVETTDTRSIVEGIRKEGGEPQRASFSADQARKAGLDLGKYPADKLIARATSRLCRQVFPDVLSGSLIAEDIIDGLIPAADEPATTAVDEAPPRAALRTPRQPPKAKAVATQPPTITAEPTPDDDLSDEPLDVAGSREAAPPTAAASQQDDSPQPSAENRDPATPQDFSEPIHEPPQEPGEPPLKPRRAQMFALLNELGIKEREDYLAICGHIINRKIETSDDLDQLEVDTIVNKIKSWGGGIAAVDHANDILNRLAIEAEQTDLFDE